MKNTYCVSERDAGKSLELGENDECWTVRCLFNKNNPLSKNRFLNQKLRLHKAGALTVVPRYQSPPQIFQLLSMYYLLQGSQLSPKPWSPQKPHFTFSSTPAQLAIHTIGLYGPISITALSKLSSWVGSRVSKSFAEEYLLTYLPWPVRSCLRSDFPKGEPHRSSRRASAMWAHSGHFDIQTRWCRPAASP